MTRDMLTGAALALLLAFPALAACPDPADTTAEIEALAERARAAETFMEGRAISAEMWQVWLRAPDEAAQEILDAGMERRGAYDFLGAMAQFTRLADYCPTYAEGYNQRAFIHFLQQDFAAALVDLDRALALAPLHVGAQSGRALTLMNLGRTEEAREQLQSALELNPWLSERALLEEGAPLAPTGRDI